MKVHIFGRGKVEPPTLPRSLTLVIFTAVCVQEQTSFQVSTPYHFKAETMFGANRGGSSGGGGGSRPMFGVTSGDGTQVGTRNEKTASSSSGGFGGGSGGERDRDRDASGGQGFRTAETFADADMATCVLSFKRGASPRDLTLTASRYNHQSETLAVATRAPQNVAARVDITTATALPFVLVPTDYGDGVAAPVYVAAQAAYARVCEFTHRQTCSSDLAPLFTDRGCPPGTSEDTLLWSLPTLDPEGTPPAFVQVEEQGTLDMLAWVAWSEFDVELLRQQTRGGSQHCISQKLVMRIATDLRALLEKSPAHIAMDSRVRGVHLLLLQVQHGGQRAALDWQTLRGASGTSSKGNTAPSDIVLPFPYPAAVDLARAVSVPTTSGVPLSLQTLVRAAVWLSRAAKYLEGANPGGDDKTAQEYDDSTIEPIWARPVPESMSASVPVGRLAFAADVAVRVARAAAKTGITFELSLGTLLANRLSGGARFLLPNDAAALKAFGESRFRHAGRRLAWVSECSYDGSG
jgi:hypothetical protein